MKGNGTGVTKTKYTGQESATSEIIYQNQHYEQGLFGKNSDYGNFFTNIVQLNTSSSLYSFLELQNHTTSCCTCLEEAEVPLGVCKLAFLTDDLAWILSRHLWTVRSSVLHSGLMAPKSPMMYAACSLSDRSRGQVFPSNWGQVILANSSTARFR